MRSHDFILGLSEVLFFGLLIFFGVYRINFWVTEGWIFDSGHIFGRTRKNRLVRFFLVLICVAKPLPHLLSTAIVVVNISVDCTTIRNHNKQTCCQYLIIWYALNYMLISEHISTTQ